MKKARNRSGYHMEERNWFPNAKLSVLKISTEVTFYGLNKSYLRIYMYTDKSI